MAAAVVTIVLFRCGVEAIGTAYLYATTGTYVPARQRFASTTNTFVQDVTRAEDCAYVDAMFPHPYVAFVHHGNPPCGMADVNNIGLTPRNHDGPAQRSPACGSSGSTSWMRPKACGRNSDNALIQQPLGRAPCVRLEDGMRKTYEWIRGQIIGTPERSVFA